MSRTEQTAKKYKGATAASYDNQRKDKKKWNKEHEIVTSLLDELVPTNKRILDVPCGTGRFIPYYIETGRKAWCLDISDDMRKLAEQKLIKENLNIAISPGNILKLDLSDDCVYAALAIRIVNLLDEVDMQKALRELQRVASHYVLFNIRVNDGSGRWRHPQNKSAVLDALLPGWELWRDLRIHEDDFRLYVLKNTKW